jgi:hypothetical protein
MFQANIGPALLYGVDYLRMGPDGRVAEFHVLVRPLDTLAALGRIISERMARSSRGGR